MAYVRSAGIVIVVIISLAVSQSSKYESDPKELT